MSSNFFKSSVVVREQETRIINSNEIVAKKLEEIARYVEEAPAETVSDVFSEGIAATEVAVLLDETDDGNYFPVETAELQEETVGHKADIQMTNKAASDILAQANAEAEQILANARREAEELKKAASQEGSAKGYAEGKKQADDLIQRQSVEFAQRKKELEDEYRLKVEELEPQLMDILTGIYEHVLGVDLTEHRDIVVHLVNSTLFKLEGVKKFLLHVSKEDYPYASMQKKEMVAGTGISVDNVEVVEDFSMKKGQCIIETDGGIFDCGFQTQMEQLRKELKLLSYE